MNIKLKSGEDLTITTKGGNTVTVPDAAGTLALTSQLTDEVTESTVSGWGFTKNTGTLTGVTFNGNSASVSNGVASITATIPDVANYFDEVSYDSQTKRINFKHGETVKKYIDATDFIKDGMVDSVEIATPESGDNAGVSCLVVTFNTDAGKEDIEIPLSSIFNPSNYYTKTETDSTFVKKADIDSVPTENSSDPVSSGGVYNTIAQSEYVISTSLNDLNTRVSGLEDDLYEGSGYLSLSGGEMDDNAEIVIPTYYNGDIITSNTLSPTGVSLINGGTEGYFGANYVILSDSTSGQSEFHPDGILFSSSINDADDGIGTTYKNGEIKKKVDSSTEYTLTLPSTSGTLALTSNLVWSPGSGTKSARLAPNSVVNGNYSAATGAYNQVLGNYSFANGAFAKTYGSAAFASGCFVSAANANGVGAAFGGNFAETIKLTGDADATTYTATLSSGDQFKFLLDNYNSSDVTSAFVNGGFLYDQNLYVAKITALSYSSGTLTITFDRTLSSTAISNKSYNLVCCISGGEGSVTFTGFTSNGAKWALAGGRWSAALNLQAFSWGNMSVAAGQSSFALGHYAQTKNTAEVGAGQFNKSTKTNGTFGNAGNTAFSVGIGTSHAARKNAIEIMQNGDLYVTGVGSYDGTNYSSASTLQSVLSNIPAAVTESTISGWGFTKNSGTYSKPSGGIPASDLTTAVQTSLGKADTALQSFTETDPVFSASAAAGITSSDITNWNGKTSNTGTITGINMNGASKGTSGVVDLGTVITSHATHKLTASNGTATAVNQGTEITYVESLTGTNTATSGDLSVSATRKKVTIPSAVTESTVSGWGFTKNAGTLTGVKVNGSNATVTSGVADIGTVITSETQLSKGTTSGSGNAVTDISVSNHQITLTKGSTFLTSHQSIKTINNQTITGTGNVTLNTLPTVSASDNGKILMVVNGAWTLVSPVTIYSGSGEPNNSMGNNGDIYLQT